MCWIMSVINLWESKPWPVLLSVTHQRKVMVSKNWTLFIYDLSRVKHLQMDAKFRKFIIRIRKDLEFFTGSSSYVLWHYRCFSSHHFSSWIETKGLNFGEIIWGYFWSAKIWTGANLLKLARMSFIGLNLKQKAGLEKNLSERKQVCRITKIKSC